MANESIIILNLISRSNNGQTWGYFKNGRKNRGKGKISPCFDGVAVRNVSVIDNDDGGRIFALFIVSEFGELRFTPYSEWFTPLPWLFLTKTVKRKQRRRNIPIEKTVVQSKKIIMIVSRRDKLALMLWFCNGLCTKGSLILAGGRWHNVNGLVCP